MYIFDIMGPIMVGPSSSHTAGAVRIGLIARNLVGKNPAKAEVLLHGSFAATGVGHGTDKAIAAGILGMKPDDIWIPSSLSMAAEQGVEISIGKTVLRGAHPNTALVRIEGKNGRKVEFTAASLGGGRVKVMNLGGMDATFTCEHPTVIIRSEDKPGELSAITKILYECSVNIASLQLFREKRGGYAVTVIESDQPVEEESIEKIRNSVGIASVTYLDLQFESD